MFVALCTFIFFFLTISVKANTEKVIFISPPSIPIPNVHPGLSDLGLISFTPAVRHTLRTRLPVAFPTKQELKGLQSWYLLEQLEPGRRYELRICWVATQPTQFSLNVHTISAVFETPTLATSLAEFSEQRVHAATSPPDYPEKDRPDEISALFLQVHAAADFFTSNQTLMKSPPPVEVDIILDPYLLNIFPRSLISTALYIIFLAVCAWFLSIAIWRWLSSIPDPITSAQKPHSD
ncbi:hypothetical protein M501DRAFT_931332 [Patellaria atrata CBS 101060]|uniref:Uncharacterized protein n=1 Tax=Patellaria atrata CBS 101060 TaxID=1346257 RepID=A0A9P4SCZ6_9PEZI|nr:hypothetical protein M501DRAFT_931332 [Patellaria atrata CBS 101060]